MYQRVGGAAYKADLHATLCLAQYLGNPEESFKSVHIAGTNGKGSTSHMLASIFQEAGYKTGLYTSPHLKDFRERIKINGEMIPEEKVVEFVSANRTYLEQNHLSFFEMTVGMAFDYFKKEEVDIAIIETGMGGRLDSTNIVTPEISVITNIGFDHTEYLGNTLSLIAGEKAGIIKPGIPVVIGEAIPETKMVFQEIANKQKAPLIFAESLDSSKYTSDLKGSYQKKNIRTVLCTIKELQHSGWEITEENILHGLSKTVSNTGLMGRWQILGEKPKVIADAAHNTEGLTLVLEQLQKENYKNLHIVFGVVDDKDLKSMLPLFPKNARYYFCKPNVPRGMDASLLAVHGLEHGLIGEEYISVENAYNAALKAAIEDDVIYVGGSTFVVAEVV